MHAVWNIRHPQDLAKAPPGILGIWWGFPSTDMRAARTRNAKRHGDIVKVTLCCLDIGREIQQNSWGDINQTFGLVNILITFNNIYRYNHQIWVKQGGSSWFYSFVSLFCVWWRCLIPAGCWEPATVTSIQWDVFCIVLQVTCWFEIWENLPSSPIEASSSIPVPTLKHLNATSLGELAS